MGQGGQNKRVFWARVILCEPKWWDIKSIYMGMDMGMSLHSSWI